MLKKVFGVVGSGIENHAKYAELIYAHDDKNIWVNLFVPSQLDWKEKVFVLSKKQIFQIKKAL
jgi:DUF1680 family protein